MIRIVRKKTIDKPRWEIAFYRAKEELAQEIICKMHEDIPMIKCQSCGKWKPKNGEVIYAHECGISTPPDDYYINWLKP